jgi:hypothetical protein
MPQFKLVSGKRKFPGDINKNRTKKEKIKRGATLS